MMGEIKFLFVSFTGLLYALKSGKISENDLKNGLFYFGCTRDHALNPGASGESNEVEWIAKRYDVHEPDAEAQRVGMEKARALHNKLVRGVTLAEIEGRVNWRDIGSQSNYVGLNALLIKNNVPPVNKKDWDHYNYPTVEELFDGSPIQVVWRG